MSNIALDMLSSLDSLDTSKGLTNGGMGGIGGGPLDLDGQHSFSHTEMLLTDGAMPGGMGGAL